MGNSYTESQPLMFFQWARKTKDSMSPRITSYRQIHAAMSMLSQWLLTISNANNTSEPIPCYHTEGVCETDHRLAVGQSGRADGQGRK